jgi:hypothetical protein
MRATEVLEQTALDVRMLGGALRFEELQDAAMVGGGANRSPRSGVKARLWNVLARRR